MLFPRKDEVLEIHRRMLEQFGGLPGMRDEGLLDSALTVSREEVEQAFARWVVLPSNPPTNP
jgi:hypothetical protein